MMTMRTLPWLGLVLAAVAGCGSSGPPQVAVATVQGKAAEPAKLQVVKSTDVERAIAAHKGRVVVVDIWAEY
jgi:hypothetical protein